MNEGQHPNISTIIPRIGTTIRFLDLEIEHKNGHLFTRMYRDPATDDYELPSVFHYHTCEPSSLLKAALYHAAHCCSDENDFHEERVHLQLSHIMHGYPSKFIFDCIDEFYNELGIATGTYILRPIIPYETLRQHVRHNYKERVALRQQKQQKQNGIRIPYPNDCDVQVAIDIKNKIINMFNSTSNNKEALNDIKFEFIPRPRTPLTMNDYLVDKRPPLRMLILPPPNNASH